MLEYYNTHSPLPEQRLFRAIITQALEDAHYVGTTMIHMRDKESAINWFLDLGKDYRTTGYMICKECIKKSIEIKKLQVKLFYQNFLHRLRNLGI